MYLDARTSVIDSLGVTWDVVHGDVHTGQFVDKGQTVSRLHVFETDCMHHENPCEGHLPVQYTFFEVAEELRSSGMMAGGSKGESSWTVSGTKARQPLSTSLLP